MTSRIIVNGCDMTDVLHPTGHCSCAGEGRCAWCKRPCPGCSELWMDCSCIDDLVTITKVDMFYDHPVGGCCERHGEAFSFIYESDCDEGPVMHAFRGELGNDGSHSPTVFTFNLCDAAYAEECQ